MISGLTNLIKRDAAVESHYDTSMYTLLVVLIVLLVVTIVSVFTLLFVRYRRRARQSQELPMYNEKRTSMRSNHRRITVRPTESIYIRQEKQNLLDNSDAPPSPTTSVPEIRIHFPEELDSDGKRQSGRVVVVHVGEKGVGLEPCDDKLPSYTQSERFQSLDLERIGGLKEKDVETRWS